ncbi:DUF411 domain-containing protein [Roseomonas sp. HF4]|uniref:DUF411 domain-containing protein n=1 Tax=Roseomonas sp. HF4 TaxID=2562313 RepID=UPI001F0EF660|nr:DUF411 domain-containing protein [Roseomonas sp. HF4]
MLGTPADLPSCHAARVEGFVLEGHVPALAVRRLLATRPAGIRGIRRAGHADRLAWNGGAGPGARHLRRDRLR